MGLPEFPHIGSLPRRHLRLFCAAPATLGYYKARATSQSVRGRTTTSESLSARQMRHPRAVLTPGSRNSDLSHRRVPPPLAPCPPCLPATGRQWRWRRRAATRRPGRRCRVWIAQDGPARVAKQNPHAKIEQRRTDRPGLAENPLSLSLTYLVKAHRLGQFCNIAKITRCSV